jgi:N-acetylglutamate synthase-like GNAT family acetyltransferase
MEYITKTEKDENALSELIKQSWRSDIIVSSGNKYKVEDLEGILTYENRKIIGLGLYYIKNRECEIVLLEALIQKQGIGTKIIEKIKEIAKLNKCKQIWLITSNDNIDAIKFYQRRGFCISNFYKNAMEESRKLKPEIPLIGEYEIPIRDEIEFEIEI